ncbi:MAG: hypothetical protein ACYTGL_29555 [Planctomycetota bacterium]|jgi:hypothetical protein
MMDVQPTPDAFPFALLGGAVLVIVLAVFWFLGSRYPRAVIGSLIAFGSAFVCLLVMWLRTAEVAQYKRDVAEARLQELQHNLRAREQLNRTAAEQASDSIDDRLPDDMYGRELAPAANTPAEVPAAWLPEVDEQFEADIYPSAELAARALTWNWRGHFEKLMTRGVNKPTHVRMTCRDRTVDVDELRLLEAMDEEIRTRFPDARVLLTTASEARKPSERLPDEISIVLSVFQPKKRSRGPNLDNEQRESFEVNGVLSAAFSGQDWNLAGIARFIEKPWLSATSEFLSLRHNTTYLVVRSDKLAASRSLASRDVLGQAANRLGHLIDPHEDQGLPRPASVMLLEQLEAGKYIADRFVQRLKRPYGDVYREALLIDIGNTNLRDMIQVTVNEVRQHLAASEHQTATRVSGVVGVVLVVGSLTVLYLLVNWLTKGYYRGPLTVVVCVAGGGALVGVLMLVGMLA